MTERDQLRALGISAGVDDDLVIIETERTFMSLTPREVEQFHAHLRAAHRAAQRYARLKHGQEVPA